MCLFCCFVWKLIRRRLPTKDELFKRNVIVRVDEMIWMFCNNHVETIDHLFASCDFASRMATRRVGVGFVLTQPRTQNSKPEPEIQNPNPN
ncbi:hypothetical protein Lal_00031363 [Lupinus albus]|nr:hypothetical protein Lal_00031363 [Lupinus albus]